MELHISPEIKICGGLGNFSSLNTKPNNHGTNCIGETNTNIWYVGGVDFLSSFILFFEISAKNKKDGYRTGKEAFIQLVIKYHHNSGGQRVRVVSFKKSFFHVSQPLEMLDYIDQFSVISTISKLAAFRSMK